MRVDSARQRQTTNLASQVRSNRRGCPLLTLLATLNKKCKSFWRMDALLRKKANFTPPALFDSGSPPGTQGIGVDREDEEERPLEWSDSEADAYRERRVRDYEARRADEAQADEARRAPAHLPAETPARKKKSHSKRTHDQAVDSDSNSGSDQEKDRTKAKKVRISGSGTKSKKNISLGEALVSMKAGDSDVEKARIEYMKLRDKQEMSRWEKQQEYEQKNRDREERIAQLKFQQVST
jgi:hypothetical protein